MGYKYLVVSALQEELDEFLAKVNPNTEELDLDVMLAKFQHRNKLIEVLTFSSDKMGMPYNAAKLMQIILTFRPRFIFFIGICAGIKEHPLGSVLVPKRVFSYESGKYENGIFFPDYTSYETSDILRKKAQSLNTESSNAFGYKVITDEDFCSGAAVINDEAKVKEIKDNGARKLSGLEMEAYSIACINQILSSSNELLVIKAISDKAINKGETEKDGARDDAKINAADFALRLIKYLEEKKIGNSLDPGLRIHSQVSEEKTAHFKLKLKFSISNNSTFPITIESSSFVFEQGLIDPISGPERSKPTFFVGKDEKASDIYKDIYILKPNESIRSCWIPVDPKIGEEKLKKMLADKKVGIWKYKCSFLANNPYSKSYSLEV